MRQLIYRKGKGRITKKQFSPIDSRMNQRQDQRKFPSSPVLENHKGDPPMENRMEPKDLPTPLVGCNPIRLKQEITKTMGGNQQDKKLR